MEGDIGAIWGHSPMMCLDDKRIRKYYLLLSYSNFCKKKVEEEKYILKSQITIVNEILISITVGQMLTSFASLFFALF